MDPQQCEHYKRAFFAFRDAGVNHEAIKLDKLDLLLHGLQHSVDPTHLMSLKQTCKHQGIITLDEFLRLIGGFREGRVNVSDGKKDNSNAQHSNDITAVFNVFDRDSDGFINQTEMGCLLRSLGCVLDSVDLSAMIAVADKDGDGKVSLEDYAAFLREMEDADLKRLSRAEGNLTPLASLREIVCEGFHMGADPDIGDLRVEPTGLPIPVERTHALNHDEDSTALHAGTEMTI